jgi:putative FmdB family regulatory protein
MPEYEFRCAACGAVSTRVTTVASRPRSIQCERCEGRAERILSRPAVKLSSASKVERLDPKYDKMVDRAMRNTPHADPDRLLKKMKPFSDE